MGSKIHRLEEVRGILGLNKTVFANAMGISSHGYQHIMADNGKGSVTVKHLENLYLSYNVNPGWVISGKGDMFTPPPDAEQPLISADTLIRILSGSFPDGWEKHWSSKIIEEVCKQVVSISPSPSLMEMKEIAFTGIFSLLTQVDTAISASSSLADSLTLNFSDHSFVIDLNKYKSS